VLLFLGTFLGFLLSIFLGHRPLFNIINELLQDLHNVFAIKCMNASRVVSIRIILRHPVGLKLTEPST